MDGLQRWPSTALLCHTTPSHPQRSMFTEQIGTECCLDKGVAYALHCARYMRKDMGDYSESQGAKYATRAIMPHPQGHHAPISLLDTKHDHHASQSPGIRQHPSQQDRLKNAPPKLTVRKLTSPTPRDAGTWVLLGHNATTVVTIQIHSGIPNSTAGLMRQSRDRNRSNHPATRRDTVCEMSRGLRTGAAGP